jgi:hypothetical protein
VASVAACLFRLIPYGYRPPNCHPVGALSLYAGGRLPWWVALPLPLAVMALSDYLLYALFGYPWFNRWAYASFVVYALLGRLLTHTNSPWRIGAVTLLGSVQFFLLTNFGVWLNSAGHASGLYPPTTAGLLDCYLMALPFFGYTLMGDLGFSALLFGAHAWLAGPAPALAPEAAEEVRA